MQKPANEKDVKEMKTAGEQRHDGWMDGGMEG